MLRLIVILLIGSLSPGCDSGDDSELGNHNQDTTYRIRYIVDGDVGRTESIEYLNAAADTVLSELAHVPFREDVLLNGGQTALLRVNANAFNAFQPLPNYEATMIASILIDDVLVASDTVRGTRPAALQLSVSMKLPR